MPTVIRTLAAVSGLAVILLPMVRVIRSSSRTRGHTVGSGTALRRWPAVLGMTVGFVAVGALLWKPLPVAIPQWAASVLLALGSLLYFPAVALYLWGLMTLGKAFGVSTSGGADVYEDHRLVRRGPYRYVRHPMYLAVLLAAPGALLIFRTWAMVVFLPMSWVVIRRADHEEAVLREAFAKEWRTYAEKVPKWVPRFRVQ